MRQHNHGPNAGRALLLVPIALIASIGIGFAIAISLEAGIWLVIALIGLVYLIVALRRVEPLLLLPLLPPSLLHWREILAARIFVGRFPLSIFDACVVAFIGIMLIRIAGQKHCKCTLHFHPLMIGLLFVAMIGSVNGLWRGNDSYDMLVDMRGIAYVLTGYVGVIALIRDSGQLRRAVSSILVIGALSAFTALRIGVMGPFVWIGPRDFYIQGVYGFRQVGTSYYYAPALLLALGLRAANRDFLEKTSRRVLFLLLTAGLVVCFSRGIFISVAIAMSLGLVYYRSSAKTIARWAALGLLVTAIVWQSLSLTLPRSLDTFGLAAKQFGRPLFEEGESGSTRLAELRADFLSVRGIGAILGNGYGAQVSLDAIAETGSYVLLRQALIQQEYRSVHNAYGWYYLKTGIFGLGILILLLSSCWMRCWQNLRNSEDSFYKGLWFGGMVWITYLAVSATNSSTLSHPTSIYSGFILGTIDLADRFSYGQQMCCRKG